MNGGDACHTEAIFYYFKFKKLKNIKTKEPLEDDEVKTLDLSTMPLLGDEEHIKIITGRNLLKE